MDTIFLVDALVATVLLILYGAVLVNFWRREPGRFSQLKFGSEPLSPRATKAVWGIVLLLPIAFSGVLAATWIPIGGSSEAVAADSPRGIEILSEHGWSSGPAQHSAGVILHREVTVQDGTVNRSTEVRMPWFLLAVCAAYGVFVMRPGRNVSTVQGQETAPPDA